MKSIHFKNSPNLLPKQSNLLEGFKILYKNYIP